MNGKNDRKAPAPVNPALLGEARKLRMGLNTPEMRAYWQERILDSKAAPPLTQEAAIGLLLETKAEDGTPIGWSLLRENLKRIITPMAKHPSEAKVAFLVKAANSTNPSIAAAAFRTAAATRPISGKIIIIAKERKEKAEAELAEKGDAADVLSAVDEFLGIIKLMEGIAKGGKEQLAAMDQLLGMYASDHGKKFGYLASFVKHRHARAMKTAIEGEPSKQVHAILVLKLFEKHNIPVDGTKAHVRIAVDALLEKGPEGWKGVLKIQFLELAPLIATSRSLNTAPFLASMVKGCDPVAVSRALDLAFGLEQIPADVVEAAISVKDDARVKSASVDFLHTLQLLQAVDEGGDGQFAAAETLVKKAGSGKPGFRKVLLALGAEMRAVSTEPSGSTPEEKQSQRDSAERIIALLAKAGIEVSSS
jgi:hypothetical protein